MSYRQLRCVQSFRSLCMVLSLFSASIYGNVPNFTDKNLTREVLDLPKVTDEWWLKDNNRKHGFDATLRQIRSAADQGNREAQYKLGQLYDQGFGLPKNQSEAVSWYRKAAGQGLVAAQHDLGVSYTFALGVEQNYAEALKWYQKAADQGLAQSQNNLGNAYLKGRGVSTNVAEAIRWY